MGMFYGHNKSITIANIKLGLLYNWYAANDATIVSSGWHIPSDAEWSTLSTYLGGESVTGGKLKETGTTFWSTPNTGAANSVMFKGRAGGLRSYYTGDFGVIYKYGVYWSSTDFDEANAWGRSLQYDSIIMQRNNGNKKSGYSLRCVRAATTSEQLFSDGTGCAAYTGNDGKTYNTVKIGTQVWLSENLAETKYTNGTTISEITSTTSWINLVTPALCAYDNNWNYV